MTRCSPMPARWAAARIRERATMSGGAPGRLAVLAHELRSPVAALAAIAEAYPDAGRRPQTATARARRGGLREHRAPARGRRPASLRVERLDAAALARDAAERQRSRAHPVVAEIAARPCGRRRSRAAAAGTRQPDRQCHRPLSTRRRGHDRRRGTARRLRSCSRSRTRARASPPDDLAPHLRAGRRA